MTKKPAKKVSQKTKPKEKINPNEELEILRTITETISSSLDLEEVLKQIVEIVVKVTKGDACLLYLLNGDKDELTLRASKKRRSKNILDKIKLKIGEGITGWVAQKNKMVAISKNATQDPRFKIFNTLSEDRYEAFLSLPIVSRSNVIGVINVQHKKAHIHSQEEIALMTTIAGQVGSAIENARLYEESTRRAAQLTTLAEVSETIASKRYLNEILQLIVTMTAEMMNSKICSIMFLDEKKGELTIEATQSLSKEYIKKAPLKLGESVSGRVVLEKRPITILDVTKEPGYRYSQLAEKEGIVSLLSVPMMIKDKAIGVINSYTDKKHKFNDEEIKILQSVANQAAVAIENTNLMEEGLATKEALETRKLVERAKGILMRESNISEDNAHKMIHKKSMDTRKTMKEIAEVIILAYEIRK
ncbi:MAG: GAF and ANTAR domain-containing protein [Nitrospinota bacterium]